MRGCDGGASEGDEEGENGEFVQHRSVVTGYSTKRVKSAVREIEWR